MQKIKKVGLFFGSFNPVHHGHLIIATLCLEKKELDAVWLVVSPHSPFKTEAELAPDELRSEMVAAAVKDHPHLELCDLEFSLPKPSYTIQTLHELHKIYPEIEFTLFIGEDNLLRFHEWRDISELLDMVHVLVYKRSGHTIDPHPVWKNRVVFLDLPVLDISATMIRDRVMNGLPITYFVHNTTEKIILKNNIYK